MYHNSACRINRENPIITMNKLYKILPLILLLILFESCSSKMKKSSITTYQPNWESIQQHKTPEWFKDAKFGIFIHWGAYSVPAYKSEWYPRLMYMDQNVVNPDGKLESNGPSDVYLHHIKKWGATFGYKDFIPMFTAEKFNAEEWVSLFEKSGAKYIVPVAEHHDGFAMYNSHVTRWNAVKMGPKRDVLGELAKATKAHGLKFGASSHFAFNWNYYQHKKGFDTMDPANYDLYGRPHEPQAQPDQAFLDQWWDRTTDIIDQYPLDLLWFDFYLDRPAFKDYHPRLAAYFYNKGIERNKEVVLQDKNLHYEAFPAGTIVLDIERGKSANIRKDTWQTDTSVGRNSWGYVKNWQCKKPGELVDDLVDIVSKNGCLLLNVGPKKNGTIPKDQKEVLLEIGNWLRTNGEAIYGTRPWRTYGEGPTQEAAGYMTEKKSAFTSEDIRFTTKGNVLYAIALAWPQSGKLNIKSLGSAAATDVKISDIKLLGSSQELTWKQNSQDLEVSLPDSQPSPFACAFKLTLVESAPGE